MLYALVAIPLTVGVVGTLLYLARDSRRGRLNWWMLITAVVVLLTAIFHLKTWLWPKLVPQQPPRATDTFQV